MILLTALFSAQTARAGVGDKWDLNNFITSLVIRDGIGNIIYDSNGAVIPDEINVTLGRTYSIELNFYNELGMSNTVEYNEDGYLIYQLPSGVTVPDVFVQEGAHKIYAEAAEIGEYTVEKWYDGEELITQLFVRFYPGNDIRRLRYGITMGISITGTLFDIPTTVLPIPPKDMELDGNIAYFSILLNPDGERLSKETPHDGRLKLTDRMHKPLEIYFSSISVRKLKDGVSLNDHPYCWEDDKVWHDWSCAVTIVSGEYTEVTYDLPDEMPLWITYRALINDDESEYVDIMNEVQAGDFYASYSDTVHRSDTWGNKPIGKSLLVTKSDAESKTALQGAEFALYVKYNYTGNPPPSGVPRWIDAHGNEVGAGDIGPDTFHYFANEYDFTHGITDARGQIVFLSPYLTPDEYYIFALYEIKAPPGYSLPAGERVTLFAFNNYTPFVDGVPVVTIETDYLSRSNTPSEVRLGGRKHVEGVVEGIVIPGETFRFTLTQVKDAGGTAMEPGEKPIVREAAAVTDGVGAYSFAFDPIYRLPIGVYYFRIDERGSGDDNYWDDDASLYIAEVVVYADPEGRLVSTVTYTHVGGDNQAGPADAVEFTNTYNPPASLIISKMVRDQEGNPVPGDSTAFTYVIKDENGAAADLTGLGVVVMKTGGMGVFDPIDLENGRFTMTHDTTVTIYGLEPGKRYTVTEEATGYTVTYTVGGGQPSEAEWNRATIGVDIREDIAMELAFTNVKYSPVLPETGGNREILHMMAVILTGLLCMICVGALVCRRRINRRCVRE